MTCTSTSASSELDFVRELHARGKDLSACAGPKLEIELSLWRAFTLEHIFESQTATELLWDGHDPTRSYGALFSLCGGHWLDLAALLLLRSRQAGRSDWFAEADQLLRDVCLTAHWDAKEIVTLFQWQRTQLT